METTDEWIQQRTGIRERHYTEGDTGAADLGAAAAREALDRAGVRGGRDRPDPVRDAQPGLRFPGERVRAVATPRRQRGAGVRRQEPVLGLPLWLGDRRCIHQDGSRTARASGRRRSPFDRARPHHARTRRRGDLRRRRCGGGARRRERSAARHPLDAPACRGQVRREALARSCDESRSAAADEGDARGTQAAHLPLHGREVRLQARRDALFRGHPRSAWSPMATR